MENVGANAHIGPVDRVKNKKRADVGIGPYKEFSYRFATTVPLFFQMLFSGTVPRTQEVG